MPEIRRSILRKFEALQPEIYNQSQPGSEPHSPKYKTYAKNLKIKPRPVDLTSPNVKPVLNTKIPSQSHRNFNPTARNPNPRSGPLQLACLCRSPGPQGSDNNNNIGPRFVLTLLQSRKVGVDVKKAPCADGKGLIVNCASMLAQSCLQPISSSVHSQQ